jgi:hypothetical protein
MTLRDTIEPKSDQLNYEDFRAGPRTLTIKTLKMGSKEQPVIVVLEENGETLARPWKPCLSMRRVMIELWGDKGKCWIGKSLTLFGDESVLWAGKKAGGIRISHMSDIGGDRVVILSAARAKRIEYPVRLLGDGAADETPLDQVENLM